MAEPREWPLLCTDAVVRNILSGAQTQDRRPLRHGGARRRLPLGHVSRTVRVLDDGRPSVWADPGGWIEVPAVGDRRWVRECWSVERSSARLRQAAIRYRSDGNSVLHAVPHPLAVPVKTDSCPGVTGVWRPSIHMPRWACRLVLPITRVWVERIQEISEADARAEGMRRDVLGFTDDGDSFYPTAKLAFRDTWDRLYQGSWERNDWVLCVEWSAPEIRQVAA